jgi:hypothetical protein
MDPISTTPTTRTTEVENPISRSLWARAPLVVFTTGKPRSVFPQSWGSDSLDGTRNLTNTVSWSINDNPVPLDVKQELEKALYIDPDQDKIRTQIEERASQVRLRVAKVQFGVWYKPSDSTNTGRLFSVEYERNFLHRSAAYLYIVYEHKLICIDVTVILLHI